MIEIKFRIKSSLVKKDGEEVPALEVQVDGYSLDDNGNREGAKCTAVEKLLGDGIVKAGQMLVRKFSSMAAEQMGGSAVDVTQAEFDSYKEAAREGDGGDMRSKVESILRSRGMQPPGMG